MSVNIFFCSNLMSALASCFISDDIFKKNQDDQCILVVEINTHHDPVYYEMLDLLVKQNNIFHKIIKLETEFNILSLRRPYKYISDIKYYKKIADKIILEIGSEIFKNISTIWAPTTSRLWPFFKNSNNRFIGIEHGLGEYITGYKLSLNPRPDNLIRTTCDKLLGYPSFTTFDSLWLCSNAVENLHSKKITQNNYDDYFFKYVKIFWNKYQLMFPNAALELDDIKKELLILCKKNYLYLPSDEIRSECYPEFIDQQMRELKINEDSLFIIKQHPGDVGSEYDHLLKKYGNCILFSELTNRFLPAEFLMVILNLENVIGSCSSTLFYTKSWLPNVKQKIYNNYDERMLKSEWRGLIKELSSVGLINKNR